MRGARLLFRRRPLSLSRPRLVGVAYYHSSASCPSLFLLALFFLLPHTSPIPIPLFSFSRSPLRPPSLYRRLHPLAPLSTPAPGRVLVRALPVSSRSSLAVLPRTRRYRTIRRASPDSTPLCPGRLLSLLLPFMRAPRVLLLLRATLSFPLPSLRAPSPLMLVLVHACHPSFPAIAIIQAGPSQTRIRVPSQMRSHIRIRIQIQALAAARSVVCLSTRAQIQVSIF
ncbi:hypothetical protein DFH09DRAFT_1336545 [Mycena vulgaris]|nr:hypothetical protein DFH09DRAFT_1336545 [Mycena vulgaris]